MNKKSLSLALALMLILGAFAGCIETAAPEAAPEAAPVVPEEEVTLTVSGSWPDCRALDLVASAFTAEYPNCTIVYEYLQDYYPSLEKRLSGDEPVDLFFTSNIQAGSELLPYALDLNSREELDLSNTFDGLIENFTFREEGVANTKLYAVPVGAEMRGLYVNKTLLDSVGLDVPDDQKSLLAACQVLKDNGYIPFHGNPGNFAHMLIYPWICSLIANADDPKAAWEKVNAREPGLSEMFKEPYAFLYTLVENDYYDYKRAQTDLNLFNDTADEDYAHYFFNLKQVGDAWEKADDLGQIAFMPWTMSKQSVLDRVRDDYHSGIEYAFMPAPVGPDGGFVYLSPAHGIGAYKDSENVDWSVKFINFLFRPENIEVFAKAFNVIPNTKEAFAYATSLYDVPDNHISHLGQVTFDYGFYDALIPSMTDMSKANNPKYMQDDGSGNLSLYPFEHYLESLEVAIKEQ